MKRCREFWVACRRAAIVPTLLLAAVGTRAAESASPVCTPTAVPVGRVYSVEEAVARFAKPSDLTGLMRNLKVALDENLLLQPAFYDARNLEKFFGGARVSPEQPQPPQLTGEWQGITTLTGTAAFGGLTARLQRTCESIDQQGGTPRARLTGAARIDVAGLTDFSVARVRASLGKETASYLDYGFHTNPKTKGRLVYARPGSPVSGAMPGTSRVAFIVKLDLTPRTDHAPAGELFSGTDVIERIEVFEVER